MTKVTLWVPAAESPRWPCVLSWLNLEYPEGERPKFLKSGPNHIRYSWNKAIRDILATDSEWVFSCHNDVVFQPGTLNRLLSWKQPIVSALIFMRQAPIVPHVWQKYEQGGNYAYRIMDTRNWLMDHPEASTHLGPYIIDPKPDDALAEVGFTSTSCVVIHRSVFEKLSDPWFEWDDDYTGGGEDRRFFENAKAAGFTGYVDRSCIAGHLVGDIPTTAADFLVWGQASDFVGSGEPTS